MDQISEVEQVVFWCRIDKRLHVHFVARGSDFFLKVLSELVSGKENAAPRKTASILQSTNPFIPLRKEATKSVSTFDKSIVQGFPHFSNRTVN